MPSLALNMSLSIASPALLIHLDGGEGMQRTNGNPFFCKLQPLKKRQFSQNMISKHMLISSLSLTKHIPTNCSRPRYWTIWRIGKALNCRESFCCLHALHLCVGCRWSFQPHWQYLRLFWCWSGGHETSYSLGDRKVNGSMIHLCKNQITFQPVTWLQMFLYN